MNQIKIKKRTKTLIPNAPLRFLICTSLTSIFFLGCATTAPNERSVSVILDKESVLIQKLQLERAQPGLSGAIAQDRNLSEAEAHLSLALDELLKANAKIQTVFLNSSTKGEKKNERQ